MGLHGGMAPWIGAEAARVHKPGSPGPGHEVNIESLTYGKNSFWLSLISSTKTPLFQAPISRPPYGALYTVKVHSGKTFVNLLS